MRGRTLGVAAVVAGVAVGGGLALGWHLLQEAPAVPDDAAADEAVPFAVGPGEGFGSVAGRLEGAGLARSALRLRLLARLTGRDRKVRAGTYDVFPGTPPGELLDHFVRGDVRLIRLTVPEGWRLDQIAEETERVLGVPADSLLSAAADPDRRARLGVPTPDLEGYLFPDTYRFPDGSTAGQIVDGMTARFEEVWESLPADTAHGLGRHEIVTLASIVEAETALEEEKPRIAAVYLNRLELGWRLQADPTVRYGLKRFTGRLYYKHLDIDTPYNSYRNDGLPPGPICAPGRAALLAVLEPLEPSDELFFVASGDGGHIFTRTQREHVNAKRAARSGE